MKGTTALLAVAVLVLAFSVAEAIPPPWTIEELKAKARTAGATGWIVKPFDPAKLVKALQMVAG